MKFEEFKTKLENNEINIEVKNISIAIQKDIINKIVNLVTYLDDNGFKRVDFALLEVFKTIYMFALRTEIEIDDLFIEAEDGTEFNMSVVVDLYDLLYGRDDTWKINGTSHFSTLLELEINQELRASNSVEAVLAKGLNTIINKLPDEAGLKKLISNLPKMINKIDQEKLKFVSDFVKANNGV